MERLTHRHQHMGNDYISMENEEKEIKCSNYCSSCGKCDCNEVKRALLKLVDYEDAEEQGLLVKLPCRIGDIVYRIRHNLDAGKISIFELEVSEINISHVNNSDVTQIVCRNNFEGTRYHYTLEEIGKYVFFTKSEAEQALAKIKGNKSERG